MELQHLLKKTIVLSKTQLKQVIEDRAAERQRLLLRRVKDSLIQEIFEKKNP